MAVPNKYKEMKDFHKYYTGERVAPILTLVIGGNHEASNYLWELYHGGWLAPNIYYLGHAGCVQVNGVRIAGASGIFKSHDFHLGYHETLPYDQSTIRSVYHIREFAVRKLSLLSTPRIFLSHDWPQSIEHYGNLKQLLRHKSFLREDIDAGKLGSPPLMSLLRTLKPEWWFSAHLHTYYEATVDHVPSAQPAHQNPDEIVIDELEDEPEVAQAGSAEECVAGSGPIYASTKFLALDKCLPKRRYLEVIDVESPGDTQAPKLTFDPEWMAITRAFQPWLSRTRVQRAFPEEGEARRMVSEELEWIMKKVGDGYEIRKCQVFSKSSPGTEEIGGEMEPLAYVNEQTVALCGLVEMSNRIA